MKDSDHAFVIHKAPHIAEAIAKNIKRLRTKDAFTEGRVTHERVAVVGGGHTMPDTLPDDLPIIAGNSAIKACLFRGRVPEYIVCRESIDMSTQFARLADFPRTSIALLDVGCSPMTWETALEVCREVWWWIPAQTQLFGMAAHFGLAPMYGGTTNVTASVMSAVWMGARAIDLYGSSRAFSAEGHAYAQGNAGWDSVRLESVDTTIENGVEVYTANIAGTEHKATLHASSGQRPPLKRERVVPLTAVDGSRRWALLPTTESGRWLETFAARHPHLSLHQHNPDVAIAGWGHAPALTLPTKAIDYRAEVLGQCDHADAVASAVLTGEPHVAELAGLVDGAELPDYHGIGDRIQIMQALRGQPPPTRTKAIMGAWRESAARVREWAR